MYKTRSLHVCYVIHSHKHALVGGAIQDMLAAWLTPATRPQLGLPELPHIGPQAACTVHTAAGELRARGRLQLHGVSHVHFSLRVRGRPEIRPAYR
jgi:hypothetical protein